MESTSQTVAIITVCFLVSECLSYTSYRTKSQYSNFELNVQGPQRPPHRGDSQGNSSFGLHVIKWCSRQRERGFPGGAAVKSLPANAGDTGSSPGRSHMPRSN